MDFRSNKAVLNHSRSRQRRTLVPSHHVLKDKSKIYCIKRYISTLWGYKKTLHRNPSPNPVSLQKSDIDTIYDTPYVVSEKSDGVRYLLLLGRYNHEQSQEPFAVMIDRKYRIFEINVVAEEHYYNGTLFDGELVWEYSKNNKQVPRHLFLVFDCVAVSSKPVRHLNYIERFEHIVNAIDTNNFDIMDHLNDVERKCIEQARQGKIVCLGNSFCIKFIPKRAFRVKQLSSLWRNRKSLKHNSDGLIFTPIHEQVQTGTHPRCFKWKANHTIDLELHGTKCVGKDETSDLGLKWSFRIYFQDNGVLRDATELGILVPDPTTETRHADALCVQVPLVLIPTEYLFQITKYHNLRNETYFEHIIECNVKLPSEIEWNEYHSHFSQTSRKKTEMKNQPFTNSNASDLSMFPQVECEILKIRKDKEFANDRRVIAKTLFNVFENITIRDLVRN